MHVMPVMMNVTVQIGLGGTVQSMVGSGIQSVTRLSIGTYKIKMQAATNFTRLYAAEGSMQSPPAGLSGISSIEVQNAPNASVAIAAGGELTIKTLSPAGALADPASGSAINILMILSNSSVVIGGE